MKIIELPERVTLLIREAETHVCYWQGIIQAYIRASVDLGEGKWKASADYKSVILLEPGDVRTFPQEIHEVKNEDAS